MTKQNFEALILCAIDRVEKMDAHPGLQVRSQMLQQKILKRAKLDQVPREILLMATMSIALGILEQDVQAAGAKQAKPLVELVQ